MGEPLRHHYTPRGTALEIFRRKDPEVVLSGPAGTGKSRSLIEKVHAVALANPGMRALMVRKTLVSLTSTGLVTYREHVAPEAIAAGVVSWYGGSKQEPAAYRYGNGSRIVVGGMDDPTKIMSSEYDLAYVQEAIELTSDDWEKITTRLRNGKVSYQQLLADTNPDAPTHWLKQRAEAGACLMLESRHEDNPVLFDDNGEMTKRGEAYMATLDRLTGVRHYRLRLGLWVAAEGVIYEFDPAVHLVTLDQVIPNAAETKERLGRELTVQDLPQEWTRYWAVDFGYVNPFVLHCYAELPDGQLLMYREIYRTQRTVDQHAVEILEAVSEPDPDYAHYEGFTRRFAHHGRKWTEPKPRAIICDHDAEGRATLAKELNLPTRAADKRVKEGIETVQRRLRRREDGNPGLLFLRDAVVSRDQDLVDKKKPASTVEEFGSYVWDVRDGGKTKDEPVKLDDHGMDTVRYLCMYRDPARRPSMRTT